MGIRILAEASAIAVAAATAVADNLEAVAAAVAAVVAATAVAAVDSLEAVVVFADLADSLVAAKTLAEANILVEERNPVGNIVVHSHNQVPAVALGIVCFGIEVLDSEEPGFEEPDIAAPETEAE